jgi:hypothetical protein
MSKKMNLIFETADLSEASPSTVCRCGMIYFETSLLGWQTLHASYYNVLKEKVIPEQLELLDKLIQWLVPAILKFVMHPSCELFVVTSELHLYNVSNMDYSVKQILISPPPPYIAIVIKLEICPQMSVTAKLKENCSVKALLPIKHFVFR